MKNGLSAPRFLESLWEGACYGLMVSSLEQVGVFTDYPGAGEIHKRQRKVMMPGFGGNLPLVLHRSSKLTCYPLQSPKPRHSCPSSVA